MSDEPAKTADEGWDDTVPKDTWRNYGATGRLAVLLAGITFCALFFPFMESGWALPVATLSAYSVLVFCLAFRDENCSLSRPQVQRHLAKFALMHVPFLILVYGIEAEWLNKAPLMPHWFTVRGRKGSLYEWVLIASLCLVAWGQEHWMRTIVKRSVRSERTG